MEKAYFAGGCFWCTEAIFQRLRGVTKVTPGYSGGKMANPTYEEVSTGTTGHREAIEIEFDQAKIDYKDLVYVFLKTHDPTQENGQGADIGKQYESAIYYTTDQQQKTAREVISEIQKDYPKPIVTRVLKFQKFFPAENYHKDYYNNHKDAMYCRVVIDPKIKKLEKNFKKYLKT